MKNEKKPNIAHIISFKTYEQQNTHGLNLLLEMV